MSNPDFKNDQVLYAVQAVLQSRKTQDPDKSYVSSLYHKGLNKILEKIGEEATEVILAAKDADQAIDKKELIAETADLWFHTMIALSYHDVHIQEVLAELSRRFGTSGLDEKAARSKK